jgi:hypothetical protein
MCPNKLKHEFWGRDVVRYLTSFVVGCAIGIATAMSGWIYCSFRAIGPNFAVAHINANSWPFVVWLPVLGTMIGGALSCSRRRKFLRIIGVSIAVICLVYLLLCVGGMFAKYHTIIWRLDY